uniref:Glycosyltransferase 2-like domain-containing protein n=1 Tax=Microcystis aeruginosa (strain PCC 7806) TaxID=267872 RepID=A8YP25_MICA7|nr:unnamed protein product [Microcystis aeruginosa PCC 7806]
MTNFSIIIPTYNRPKRFKTCLDSLLNLDYLYDYYNHCCQKVQLFTSNNYSTKSDNLTFSSPSPLEKLGNFAIAG